MDQVIEMVGALVVLSAFVANQVRHLPSDSPLFLAGNAVGTGILCAVAAVHRDAGFVLVEGAWSLVSLAGLARSVRRSVPGS